MNDHKKHVNALTTRIFTDAEQGFDETVDTEELTDTIYVPLEDGEYYISFSNYFKSRKLKPRTGLAVFKELGLIERDGASDHWLPHGEGWGYCVAKPGNPNHFGLYSKEMRNLINRHKINFVRLYNKFEDPDDIRYVVKSKISPTVKLPVIPIVRTGVHEYAEAKGIIISDGDFSEVIGSLLVDAGY